jgi:hypothetical protein
MSNKIQTKSKAAIRERAIRDDLVGGLLKKGARETCGWGFSIAVVVKRPEEGGARSKDLLDKIMRQGV